MGCEGAKTMIDVKVELISSSHSRVRTSNVFASYLPAKASAGHVVYAWV